MVTVNYRSLMFGLALLCSRQLPTGISPYLPIRRPRCFIQLPARPATSVVVVCTFPREDCITTHLEVASCRSFIPPYHLQPCPSTSASGAHDSVWKQVLGASGRPRPFHSWACYKIGAREINTVAESAAPRNHLCKGQCFAYVNRSSARTEKRKI